MTVNMTEECYRKLALATESKHPHGIPLDPQLARILHAIIGKVTESAEMLDALKKHIFYGRPLDTTNLGEELGDDWWYDQILLDAFNWTPERVRQTNIDKLRRRYSNGSFDPLAAVFRDLAAEREALEHGIGGRSLSTSGDPSTASEGAL
jgi:hypothetical protein